MKFTTKTGDAGMTDIHNERVEKCCDTIELLGTLDEAASVISLARCELLDEGKKNELSCVINCITKIAACVNKKEDVSLNLEIEFLEERICYYEENAPDIKLFEYPSKKDAALIDYARCVVRRAERCAVRCKRNCLYLNRLSDYLFVLSRYMECGEKL